MKRLYRWIALILTVCLVSLSIPMPNAQAVEKNLSLNMAKSMGLANSKKYQQLQTKLELTTIQYEQAIKAIQLKEKNQSTFRWSPLLNFQFPTKPNLSEAFEYQYKPLELQSNLDVLNRQISDMVYQVYYDISSLFTKIYVLQEKITFNEKRLSEYNKTLDKNKKRLLLGMASENDITSMENKISAIESTLVSDKSNFEAQKKKLGDLIGIDVVVGYKFGNPFVEGEISRDTLEDLTAYTLEKDYTYYQAETATNNALLAMNTNYNLMKSQYGADITMLDSFINQIKSGDSVDAVTFKKKYQEFLKKVDEPWTGSYRILFISFPKEWLKGSIDGVRYVEDEPYILYECALEYQDLVKEQESTKTEISNSVTDTFENYISAKKAVESLTSQRQGKREELIKAKMLNSMGKMTYEEYDAVQAEFEELELELIQAKADYSEILFGFDRLTCGKISDLLGVSASFSSTGGSGGYSYAVANEGEGVYYYIHQLVSDNVFDFGLTVTEDADVELTHFELWVNGIQIGSRTGLGDTIRHLTLNLTETERVFVRIYNNETFVDDCDIDPRIYSAKLDITKDYSIVSNKGNLVGSYDISIDERGIATINFIPEIDELFAYYTIQTESGEYLIDDEKRSIKNDFVYLGLASGGLDELVITFYDKDENLMYKAKFQTTDKTLRKIEGSEPVEE